MVDLHTDVACDVVGAKGVTIAVGAPGDDTTGIATRTTSCDGGAIGTLALVPRGDIGGPVAVRVVLGVNAKADDCALSNDFSGCIVARRSLRYSPHTRLSLPIDLDQDCLDNPCGADSTCIHGACSDAGVTCADSTCEIDAGTPEAGPPPPTPDAGACTDTPPTLVGSTSVDTTPRMSRTAKGYAITWFTAAGAISAEIVDVNGNVISAARPIAQVSGAAKLDAIATDTNDENYLVVYEDAGTLYANVAPTSGGTAVPFVVQSTSGPLSGAFWEATQTLWVTAGLSNGAASLYTLSTQNKQTPFDGTNPSHVALTRFGTTYYPTDVEGSSCELYTCALQSGGAFGCGANAFPSCTSIRAAADATNVVVSYVSGGGTLNVQRLGSGGFFVSSGPIDDVDAMVPLVVGSTPYRVVWRSSGAILTDTFPVKGTAATTLDASGLGSTSGTGAGFDAVADDPAETGYAVAYVRGGPPPTIQFLHRCK
jgi:hypothetical protein